MILRALAVCAVAVAAAVPIHRSLTQADTIGTVTVTGVQTDTSSVKITWQPYPGAADYRVMDLAHPSSVKYAGLSSSNWTPLTSVEQNSVEDGQPHTLVIQAVDALGPADPMSFYDKANNPLSATASPCQQAGMASMLGMDRGATPDGMTSTNGQGPCSNNPQVIAQSAPFTVQSDPSVTPLQGGTQQYLDTFEDSENATITRTLSDVASDHALYRINDGTPQAATLNYIHSDVRDSYPFVQARHFMDVLFDGGTPGSRHALHALYGDLLYTPDQAETPGTDILHLTMEVDAHFTPRRWAGFVVYPNDGASTPYNLDPQAGTYSATNNLLEVKIQADGQSKGVVQTVVFNGGASAGAFTWKRAQNGIGLDNRSRFDLYVSQSHIALFEDGALVGQGDISPTWFGGGLTFAFVHNLYHSAADVSESTNRAATCYPENSLYFNNVTGGTPLSLLSSTCAPNPPFSSTLAYPPGYGQQYSDERHWDDFGAEVRPLTDANSPGDFSSLAPTMPQVRPPQ